MNVIQRKLVLIIMLGNRHKQMQPRMLFLTAFTKPLHNSSISLISLGRSNVNNPDSNGPWQIKRDRLRENKKLEEDRGKGFQGE